MKVPGLAYFQFFLCGWLGIMVGFLVGLFCFWLGLGAVSTIVISSVVTVGMFSILSYFFIYRELSK